MTQKTKLLTFTEDKFQSEVLEGAELILVAFSADWCGPCHIMTPVIEQVASDFAGQVMVGKLDVDQNPRVAAQYGIRSTPTLLFFRNGQLVHHVVGVAPKRVLVEKLHALLQRS